MPKPQRPPLEQRLTLVAWFVNQLGYDSNVAMLKDLQESSEDWGDGLHPVLLRATARVNPNTKIPKDVLEEMDDNIRSDLEQINKARSEPIVLKYFQYLAVLAVEYLLKLRAEQPKQLVKNLQDFANAKSEHYPAPSKVDDLNKLALWMATGAGKTLLMHLNYRQFLRYQNDLFVPDNIILVTPNETLTAQHIEEMHASGIPCFQHGQGGDGGLVFNDTPIRVLEISKLTEEKRSDVRVPTNAFQGRNLVFVDEGHKGSGGDAWFARRDELAKDGFVFEYSATYGQAFKPTPKPNTREDEYARSIVVDYSYRHFHNDGYGKDFDVVNLDGNPQEEQQNVLMLGNLLVFLQQRICFETNYEQFSKHNLESPLLLLLGARVTGSKPKTGPDVDRTDIVNFLRFLHRVTTNKKNWVQDTAGDILSGNSGIRDSDGRDVFNDRLKWLRKWCKKMAGTTNVHNALLKYVFHADTGGRLQFCPIANTNGEVALRVSGGSQHFGLIYVGDVKRLQKLTERDCRQIKIFEESLTTPLFPKVASPQSPINILIGAKKFMEGWSSWRVSGMGLLNVGKSEGPLIIQLFGRGVRLKGANMSLKRGGGDDPPKNLSILETMNIFGIRAGFISNFREMLEREGVWEETLFLPVTTWSNDKLRKAKLLVPKYPDSGFVRPTKLIPDGRLPIKLDISSSVMHVASNAPNTSNGTKPKSPPTVPKLPTAALDWNDLHRRIQEYRVRAGLWNLALSTNDLRKILLSGKYEIICDSKALLEPTSPDNIRRIQNTAFAVLRKYVDRFYNSRRGQWAKENISYKPIEAEHPNLFVHEAKQYTLSIPHDNEHKAIIDELRALIDNQQKLDAMLKSTSDDWDNPPPRLYFDNHLYQPLLVAQKLQDKGIRVVPQGLNTGEAQFVEKLQEHLKDNPLQANESVFLLRNRSRAGVGFFSDLGSTYPDFILWIKRGNEQRVVFVEPHGMVHAPAYDKDPKATLPETLKPLNTQLAQQYPDIQMDSYLISQTKYDDLKDSYDDGKWTLKKFRDHNILFFENCIAHILK